MAIATVEFVDLIGAPFAFGGRGPELFDCYGLLWEMKRREGILIPDYVSPRNHEEIALLLADQLPRWERIEARPGAAIAIRLGRYVAHVGYMLDDGKFIHTWERSGGVCVERIAEWERRIVGYYEFVK